jgi:TPR repeat protein
MASEKGDAAAQSNLGFMYDSGRGVPQSDTEAVFWYRKAAEQGHVFAQSNLGTMCVNGRGTPQSDTEAVKWQELLSNPSFLPALAFPCTRGA